MNKNASTERIEAAVVAGDWRKHTMHHIGDQVGRVLGLCEQGGQHAAQCQERMRHHMLGVSVVSEVQHAAFRQFELSYCRLRHV